MQLGQGWKVAFSLVSMMLCMPAYGVGAREKPYNALLQRAHVAEAAGDKATAAALYHRALQIDGSDQGVRAELAELLVSVEAEAPFSEQSEALMLIDHNLREPINASFNFPLVFLNNGALEAEDEPMGETVLFVLQKLQNNDNRGAIKLAEGLRKKYPTHPTPYNLVGLAWEGLGDPSQARESFQQALALKENFHAARINLAELALHLGEFETAHQELDKVLKQDQQHRRACLVKAQLHDLEGHPEIANEWYSKVSAEL